MTFEEWLEKEWVPIEGQPDKKMERIARYAWEAGYFAATDDQAEARKGRL